MKIYYSVSVRGGAVSKEMVRKHIEIMEKYGEVLTKHLGSDSTDVVDMGKSDRGIYEEDMKLLESCDIFISDVTSASLGVGFMIAKALQLNKPVLCLCKKEVDKECPKISAMINGCPDISKSFYHSYNSYENLVKLFIKRTYGSKIIFLTGPPGSGKSTLGNLIAEKMDVEYISTGQLLRSLDPNLDLGREVNEYMEKGVLVPAYLMYSILKKKLKEDVCIKKGFILDGYPPSYDDLQYLVMDNVRPDLVIALTCSDEIAIKRQCSRAARVTDNEETARKRMEVYHDKIPPTSVLKVKWFPNSPVVEINAEQNMHNVHSQTLTLVKNFFEGYQNMYSYFPVLLPEGKQLNSTRFHFHVDGENHSDILEIARNIHAENSAYNGQIKIYPIESLELGPQTVDQVYKTMMNFHQIKNSTDEAFITGKIGEVMDYNLLNTVLYLAKNSGKRYMVELEQYLGEWTYQMKDNKFISEVKFNEIPFDSSFFNKFKPFLNKNLPPYELHLAFDVSKIEHPIPPIELHDLIYQCTKEGFDNGGWFIFKDKKFWKYRSNEFTHLSYEDAVSKIFDQVNKLSNILMGKKLMVDIGMSIEIVHGIWQF